MRLQTLWNGAICWAVLGGMVACKQERGVSTKYPIVDERGDTPRIGSLAGDLENPFHTSQFDEASSCRAPLTTDDVSAVTVRVPTDKVPEDLSTPRKATAHTLEFAQALSFHKGLLSARWLEPSLSGVGEVAVGTLSLGNFPSKAAGIEAARGFIDNDQFQRTVQHAQRPLSLCKEIVNNQVDLTGGRSRMDAALGVAAIIGNEVQFFESFVTQRSPLFEPGFRVAPFGLNLLNEVYVDYSFVAPNEAGRLTRFYLRHTAADNLAFYTSMQYGESFSGGHLKAHRHFLAMPHSSLFAQEYLNAGAFYRTPFAIQHEFAHLLFAESVRRDVSVTLAETGFSFFKAAMFVPKMIFGIDTTQSVNDIRYLRGRSHSQEAATSFKLLEDSSRARLSGADRAELARRIDYVHRGIEEAVADLYALARNGDYSGFRLGCIGGDRDPRVREFGWGSSNPHPKAIPSSMTLTSYLGHEESWRQQAHGGGVAVLASRKECASGPLTLQSAYTLASIVSAWIDSSVREVFGKSLSEFDERARIALSLHAIAALENVWKPWTALVSEGYHHGRFSDFTDLRSDEILIEIAERVSLDKSIRAILDGLFGATDSWYALYRSATSANVAEARASVCEKARSARLILSCP